MLKINPLPFIVFLFVGIIPTSFAQQSASHWYTSLEYSIGRTTPANVDFPSLGPQHGILVSLGTTNMGWDKEWKKQLHFPETGCTLSYVLLGNGTNLGTAYSITPFVNFKIFRTWSPHFNLKVGLGASYFDTRYHPISNPNNKAISTAFTWAFRTHLYYSLLQKSNYNVKLGLGYFHNSNGHTRLPNNGLNTFLVSINSQFNFSKKEATTAVLTVPQESSTQRFYSSRVGLGRRVLSLYDNSPKSVYTFAASSGWIWKKTFKLGYGLYYRFYQDYYDYIKNNGKVVADLHPDFRDYPVRYASNVGVFGSGELLLSHVGMEFEMGINLYKPSYAFDWQINEEKYKDGAMQLGELNTYYHLKKTISTRLGVKGYLIDTDKAPQHNVFIGAYINANLGQADFSELTLGYQYALPLRSKKKT